MLSYTRQPVANELQLPWADRMRKNEILWGVFKRKTGVCVEEFLKTKTHRLIGNMLRSDLEFALWTFCVRFHLQSANMGTSVAVCLVFIGCCSNVVFLELLVRWVIESKFSPDFKTFKYLTSYGHKFKCSTPRSNEVRSQDCKLLVSLMVFN